MKKSQKQSCNGKGADDADAWQTGDGRGAEDCGGTIFVGAAILWAGPYSPLLSCSKWTFANINAVLQIPLKLVITVGK